MAIKKETGKKGGFALAPITLLELVKATDGFTNLVEIPAVKKEKAVEPQSEQGTGGDGGATKTKREVAKAANQTVPPLWCHPAPPRMCKTHPWQKQTINNQRRAKTGRMITP